MDSFENKLERIQKPFSCQKTDRLNDLFRKHRSNGWSQPGGRGTKVYAGLLSGIGAVAE